MNFTLELAVPLLARTPSSLDALLRDLPAPWLSGTEGADTWSPYDVIGHLIHGERTDWIPRVEHLLTHGERVPFPPFDRFGHFDASRGKGLTELLDTFAALRADSLRRLADLNLTDADLERPGHHPEFGTVRLREHLATWVAHDLDHVAQIARVMARQYAEAVGPWRRYLRVIGTW
jgi:hypothetical protein